MSPVSLVYLGALLFSLAGMVLLDLRHRLFFGRDPRRAGLVLVVGVVFFLLWDLAGIATGIFLHGASTYATGWMLAPQLPVEELVFLIFLCYLTMNLVALLERLLHRLRPTRPAAPLGDDAPDRSSAHAPSSAEGGPR